MMPGTVSYLINRADHTKKRCSSGTRVQSKLNAVSAAITLETPSVVRSVPIAKDGLKVADSRFALEPGYQSNI